MSPQGLQEACHFQGKSNQTRQIKVERQLLTQPNSSRWKLLLRRKIVLTHVVAIVHSTCSGKIFGPNPLLVGN